MTPPLVMHRSRQEVSDRMVLRANSEALPWAPVPEGGSPLNGVWSALGSRDPGEEISVAMTLAGL